MGIPSSPATRRSTPATGCSRSTPALAGLRPGEEPTRQRRPIVPTLAPGLDGAKGKAIRHRVPTSQKTRDAGEPDFYDCPTSDIKNAFAGVLLAAHELPPILALRRSESTNRGMRSGCRRAKLGEAARRPDLRPIGSLNTLRHMIHTWDKRRGVSDAQIGPAARKTRTRATHTRAPNICASSSKALRCSGRPSANIPTRICDTSAMPR